MADLRRHPRIAVCWLLLVVLAAGPAFGDEGQFLSGRVLVATEKMPDSIFAQTVIYMVEHNADGALGIVLNRPVGRVSVANLYESMGLETTGVEGNVTVHAGGPVEPGVLFVLHSDDYESEQTATLPDGLAITTHPHILAEITKGTGPSQYLFALGYAGWAPGQLESEMKTGSWIDVELDPGLPFDTDDQAKWSRALSLREIEL